MQAYNGRTSRGGVWLVVAGLALVAVGCGAFTYGASLNAAGVATCSNFTLPCPVTTSTAGTIYQVGALLAFLGSGIVLTLGVQSHARSPAALPGAMHRDT